MHNHMKQKTLKLIKKMQVQKVKKKKREREVGMSISIEKYN